MIDNRKKVLSGEENDLFARWCERRFGVGADGLILLEDGTECDFSMNYFNADGKQSSMCGNGGRCIVKFAEFLGIINDEAHFSAIDGLHHALINGDGTVSLKMIDVPEVKQLGDEYVLDTGSPHFVSFVEDVDGLAVKEKGGEVRNSDLFKKEGINVNWVKLIDGGLKMRTYERGVEDETFSCGTGVTAAALAASSYLDLEDGELAFNVYTLGGNLRVNFEKHSGDSFTSVWLNGPAEFVFKGTLEV